MVKSEQCKPGGDAFASGYVWMESIWSEVGRGRSRHGLDVGIVRKSEARSTQK